MNNKPILIAATVVLLAALWGFAARHHHAALNTVELPATKGGKLMPTKYLAFQIFIPTENSTERNNFPPLPNGIGNTVDDIIRQIGTVGSKDYKLGFIPGPISFNNTDEQVRQLIRESFAIALKRNIAVGFHIDDSMFWDRLSSLNKPENIEWIDWNKTVNTGRRLDWSSTPTKIMPQLCLNSPAVKGEVKKRGMLIGQEVKRALVTLKAAGKEHLFIGVINGWETQIGRDFGTGKSPGYNALTIKGYSAQKPPVDIDEARVAIVKEFVDFWAKSLADGGVPGTNIYSHIAFMPKLAYDPEMATQGRSYLVSVNFTPPRIAFGQLHRPGFSTYPMPGHLEEIYAEVKKNGNVPWASSEGTAIDPGIAEKGGKGMSMEAYLGNLFNHGAVLVNVFGWAVGDSANPFRKVAENRSSIEAYQKFLHGGKLKEGLTFEGSPSIDFIVKMRRIQKELPLYVQKHGPQDVKDLAESLDKQLKAAEYAEASKTADEIVKILDK